MIKEINTMTKKMRLIKYCNNNAKKQNDIHLKNVNELN